MTHTHLTVVNQGEEAFLDLILAVGYTLRLYQNDVVAGLSDEEIDALIQTDFTEATFTGYASSAITGGTWTTTQGNPSVGVNTERPFIRTSTGAAQLIYGYYLTRTSDGALQWFEQFSAPISMEFTDDTIKVTPTVTLDDAEGNAVESGVITAFGGTAAPAGWLLCDGSAVSRTTFASLFAVVGTTYGVGDGSTTFNVPDLRQRFPLGKATSGTGATLGGTGGAIDHVHGLDTASSHARIAWGTGTPGTHRMQRKTAASWTATHNTQSNGAGDTNAVTLGAALGGDSDTENPPFQVVNYLIHE